MNTPDLIEPLLVFRYFNVSWNGVITSLAYTRDWRPGWQTATCGHRFPPDKINHPPTDILIPDTSLLVHGKTPAAYCTCGFHAYFFPGQLYLAESVIDYVAR